MGVKESEILHLHQLSSFDDIEAWIMQHVPRLLRPNLSQNSRVTKFEFVRKKWGNRLYGRDARAAGLDAPSDASGHIPFTGWQCEANVITQGGIWWDAAILRELGFIPLREWRWTTSPMQGIEFLMEGAVWLQLAVMEKLRAN